MSGQGTERELEELGVAISLVEPPQAHDAFRSQLRARLVATAATEWSARRARPSLFPFLFGQVRGAGEGLRPAAPLLFAPRFAPVVALLVVAMLVGGSGVVAAASLPGDPAYPLKVAFERVELAVARDDAARAEVLTRHADRRLEELRRSSETRPETAPTATEAYQVKVQELRDAIDALHAASGDGRRDAALDVAAAAAAKHVAVLVELKRRHETPGLDRAIERARDLHEHAKEKRDRKKGEDQKEERPATAPTASPARTGRPTATPAIQREATPRPDETPKPGETPRTRETPKPTERP